MRSVILFTALLYLTFCGSGNAQVVSDSTSKNFYSIGIRGNFFSSRASSPGGTPLKLSNPELSSSGLALNLGFSIHYPYAAHEFALELVLPSKLKLNDGLGNDFVLNENESTYFLAGLDYHFTKRLFSIGNFNFLWGAGMSILYELSDLKYVYGGDLKRWDITAHPGIVIAGDYTFLNSFSLFIKLRPMFTLGILNTGNYSFSNPGNDASLSYSYHSSGFYSIFQAGIKYIISPNSFIEAAYFRNGTINNASRQMFPSDYQNSLDKIYRNEGFLIKYYLNAGLLW